MWMSLPEESRAERSQHYTSTWRDTTDMDMGQVDSVQIVSNPKEGKFSTLVSVGYAGPR
jgi:hypothetical protein